MLYVQSILSKVSVKNFPRMVNHIDSRTKMETSDLKELRVNTTPCHLKKFRSHSPEVDLGPHLLRLAKNDKYLTFHLLEMGWNPDCHNNDLIIYIYEHFSECEGE